MSMGRARAGALALAAGCILATDVAAAATIEVTTRRDPAFTGVCKPAKCSLREAAHSANTRPGPDRIVLPSRGVYYLSRIGAGEDIEVGDLDVSGGPLRIIHPGGGRATISANPPNDPYPDSLDRVFEVAAGASLKLERIVVTDGGDPSGSANGGGINTEGDLTLLESEVAGNVAPGYGGGIHADGAADLEIRDSAVTDNKATGGAGIYQGTADGGGGALTLVRSDLSRNRAGLSFGGGLYLSTDEGVTSVISESTISRNRVGYEGGGIYATQGGLVMQRSTVSGNRAGDVGGGLEIDSEDGARIENSTVAENKALTGSGGGIHSQSLVELNAVTVSHNVAYANAARRGSDVAEGGGIWADAGSVFEVENSLVVLNEGSGGAADDCGGTAFVSLGHNILSANDDCSGFTAEGDSVEPDPAVGPLSQNGGPTETVALMRGSPAIGAARKATMPGVDQRGRARRDPDIGAFERRP